MHTRSKHWHLIDDVITRRRDIRDILITRAMRGADCWTGHLRLRWRAAFQLTHKHRRQASSAKKKVDVKKLSEPLSKIPSRMPYSSLDHSVRVEPDTSTVV